MRTLTEVTAWDRPQSQKVDEPPKCGGRELTCEVVTSCPSDTPYVVIVSPCRDTNGKPIVQSVQFDFLSRESMMEWLRDLAHGACLATWELPLGK